MIHQSLNGQWSFRALDGKEWLPAAVPGGVHTDLLALGKIPDPFVADNEKRVQWIAETDWEYRTTFAAASDLIQAARQFLVCDGLDTLAEVSLNGSLLGKTDNAFRCWTWDLAGLLRPGGNELRIVFRAPVNFIRARQAEFPLLGGGDIPGGPHLRKAPCQWGWDWGPKLPPIGIWKDIRLEGYSTAKLEAVHIRQIHADGKVTISAGVRIQQWEKDNLRVTLTITSPGSGIQTLEAVPETSGDGSSVCDLQSAIEDPQYWWPNGYGPQPLYKVEAILQSGETTLDRQTVRVGLRTVGLCQKPDQWGESFTFIVNGVPIFIKGADWIPADSFPTRIPAAHLERLIRDAAAANMNMLRVWGGGYYPEDRFFDLCDQYGILIWQDFMFACGVYPEDDAFAENVRVEAVENVRRLRHHASLALWCGNNEMEQGWVDWTWNKQDAAIQRLKAGYDRMFHHLLPGVVAAEDPDRPYWPSSASSGIPFADPNGQQRGDTHYWDVWHKRQPFTAYLQQFPRFMSEFGFQSLPPYKTIQTYAAPEQQNITSYIMEHHQRNRSGNSLIISQMSDHFRMPKDFPSLVYLSMVLQAEGIRTGVEHWRRNRQRVGGTLYWQLNDCWPVASWSSLDYFGRWKALHYAARRFYAPLLLSVAEDAQSRSVHVTSDLLTSSEGTLRWSLESLAGKVLEAGEETVHAAPLADTKGCSLDFSEKISDANCRETVLVCELFQGRERLSWCVSSFVPDKHLALTGPGLKCALSLSGDTLTFILSAASLARFVEISLEGADAVFSDNYFDLPAGRIIRVTAPIPSGWNLEQARQALRLRSLYDSYA